MKKDTYCSFCGMPFDDVTQYPRHCGVCSSVAYVNPLPVVVVLVPVQVNDHTVGVLTVRRSIEPKLGELALPGGYLEVGESWQKGAVRELMEETGVLVPAEDIRLFDVETAPSNSNLLVFCHAPIITMDQVNSFKKNSEVSELVVVTQPTELAFPTHTSQTNKFLTTRLYAHG